MKGLTPRVWGHLSANANQSLPQQSPSVSATVRGVLCCRAQGVCSGLRISLTPLTLEMDGKTRDRKQRILVLMTMCVPACDRRAVCDTAHVLNAEYNFAELILSSHLYTGFENQTRVARLVWQSPTG